MEKVTIVRGDNWEGIYLDGKLIDQGHTIDWYTVLTQHFECYVALEEADDEWLSEEGALPNDLVDCQLN